MYAAILKTEIHMLKILLFRQVVEQHSVIVVHFLIQL